MKKTVGPLPEVDPVKLPTVLGMRPGVYILILTILIIALVVFLIGFLPGILHGGKKVTFTSPVSSVAVTIDGQYMGGTPFETFLPSGKHEVQFSKDGVLLQSMDVKISHPVFFTWLFPRRQTIANDSISITAQGISQITQVFLDNLTQWSAVTDFDDRYHFPPLYTNWASDMTALVPMVDTPATRRLVQDAWTLACAQITSNTLLENAMQAKTTLSSAGLIYNNTLSDDLLAAATRLFEENSNATTSIGLEPKAVNVQANNSRLQAGSLVIDGFSYSSNSFVMGEETLAIWPAVTTAGVSVSTAPFSIAATEVTEYQWALFMEQNPYWSKANIEQLVLDGMVDEYYLAGIFPTTSVVSSRPIRNISYKSAQAFCDWLSQSTKKQVFIPSEAQWTLAAMSSSNKTFQRTLVRVDSDTSSPSSMLGGVWEFTSTDFIPLARVSGNYAGLQALGESFNLYADKVVKGGSFINSASDITVDTVGTADPTACGEYIGFRIAWE